jgi:hypothetical protein
MLTQPCSSSAVCCMPTTHMWTLAINHDHDTLALFVRVGFWDLAQPHCPTLNNLSLLFRRFLSKHALTAQHRHHPYPTASPRSAAGYNNRLCCWLHKSKRCLFTRNNMCPILQVIWRGTRLITQAPTVKHGSDLLISAVLVVSLYARNRGCPAHRCTFLRERE